MSHSIPMPKALLAVPQATCYEENCEKLFKPNRIKTWKLGDREFCSATCLNYWLMIAKEHGYKKEDFI